ncbi:MAG: carbon storage regulator CsrA [Phycisphaerae bacterium]|nr:carbon storage regulator CsrA [Phycisphaerae bacterium]
MLVLSRQRDETIMIGDDVEITVVDIRGDKVRLGITAPRHIQVHRKEVYEAIKRENQQAAQLRVDDVSRAVNGENGNGAEPRIEPTRPKTDPNQKS